MNVLSDLNLNGPTPSRVQPKVGVWGPRGVRGTRAKKWFRALAYVAFLLVTCALVGYGWFFYSQLKKAAGN